MSAVHRLVGVGVGPGDPELMTRKAITVLREADVVLVPTTARSADGPGRAELTVLAHLDPVADPGRDDGTNGADSAATIGRRGTAAVIRRVEFSMAEAGRRLEGAREQNWDRAAQVAVEAFEAGAETVAFATIGDPSVYSTFSYLAETALELAAERSLTVEVDVVPGITAMQALAATSRTPLCEGTERLVLVPTTAGLDAVTEALDSGDNVVVYKVGRHLSSLREAVQQRHRAEGAVVGEHVGLEDEHVSSLHEFEYDQRANYLTSMIVPARREGRGAAL